MDKNPKKAVIYRYKSIFWRKPDLRHPKSINEKLQVLKLGEYFSNTTITTCVDKYLVKKYLSDRGYQNLCAKLYGVYNRPEDIRWDELPDKFVIKCNHGCDYNIICKNKKNLDTVQACNKLHKWLSVSMCGKESAEFQYRNIDKKIIAEEYLGDSLETYKFYCFNGEPKVLYLSRESEMGEKDFYLDFYDMEWNHLDISLASHMHYPKENQRPENLNEMINVAKELSKPFPFVRLDLYSINSKIYFSEFTFMPTAGYMKLEPKGTDKEWGSWLHLK